MKHLHIFLVCMLFAFGSCTTAEKITRAAAPKVRTDTSANTPENIVFNFSGLERKSSLISSDVLRSQFIPAIFFWQWNDAIQCKLDPVVVAKLFQADFSRTPEAMQLKERLGNRRLELSVQQLPDGFTYTHKGYFVFVLVAYAMTDQELILPADQNLVVSYRLLQDGEMLKQGTLESKTRIRVKRNVLASTRRYTSDYMDKFNQNTKDISREIAAMLIDEI